MKVIIGEYSSIETAADAGVAGRRRPWLIHRQSDVREPWRGRVDLGGRAHTARMEKLSRQLMAWPLRPLSLPIRALIRRAERDAAGVGFELRRGWSADLDAKKRAHGGRPKRPKPSRDATPIWDFHIFRTPAPRGLSWVVGLPVAALDSMLPLGGPGTCARG